MRWKSLSVLAGVGLPLVAAGSAHGGFVGITTEVKSVPPQTPNVGGALVVNVFATFDRPGTDRFISAAGTPLSPMDISVVGGTFYQNQFGSDTAPSAALIPVFPSLAFDTFVTIGQKSTAQPAPPLTLTPGWADSDGVPGGSGFGPSTLGGDNLSWANTPAAPNTDPFNPAFINGNGSVLIGQFTTLDGTGIVGMLRVLVTSNGVGTQLNVEFSASGPPPPSGGAAFYTDPAAFDDALVGAGKASKAAWNFEPNSVDGPDGVALDDPLDIDTHALDPDDPWGKLWPPDVDNARFLGNTTPGGALTPRGSDALAFLTEGFLGVDQDLLGANFLADSLCIESGVPHGLDHSAIGLSLVTPFAPANLVVAVYDPDDSFMGATQIQVSAAQPAFLGILGIGDLPTLGRIDIHDPADGFEGVSSITLYRDNAVFFTDPAEFTAFNATQGKALAATETFEESNVPPAGVALVHDSLISHGAAVNGSGAGFPSGLAESGLLIQTNVTPGPAPPEPNPSGTAVALAVLGSGLSGANSTKVGEFLFGDGTVASLDVMFTEYCPWDCDDGNGVVGTPDFLELLGHWGVPGPCDFDDDGIVDTLDFLALLAHWGVPPQCVPPVAAVPTAVAFELSHVGGPGTAGWHVTVYDRDDVEIGQFAVPAPGGSEPLKTFVGISCISTIGRVNIYDEAGLNLDAIDDIQLWE
jgi:hypothetical protein